MWRAQDNLGFIPQALYTFFGGGGEDWKQGLSLAWNLPE